MRGLPILVGLVLLCACKRVKLDPVVKDQGNDTAVYEPTYLCVKTALLKVNGGETRFTFEYTPESRVKAMHEYALDSKNDTLKGASFFYGYADGKMVNRKLVNYTASYQTNEEKRAYNGGRLTTVLMQGYGSFDDRPIDWKYSYSGDTINTRIIYASYEKSEGEDTVFVERVDRPDSASVTIAYTQYNMGNYPYREGYDKRKGIVYAFNGADTVYLSSVQSRVDPFILKDILYRNVDYGVYTSFPMRSILLDPENNVFLISSVKNHDIIKEYEYSYDTQGRLSKMNEKRTLRTNGDLLYERELTFTY